MANGNSALHLACENGDYESVRVLTNAGADIYMQNKEQRSPINIAEQYKDRSSENADIYHLMMEISENREIAATKAKDELV